MTERTFRDAYGYTATIQDEGRGEYPYRLKVCAGNGHMFCNRVYATYRGARAALTAQGEDWKETTRATA